MVFAPWVNWIVLVAVVVVDVVDVAEPFSFLVLPWYVFQEMVKVNDGLAHILNHRIVEVHPVQHIYRYSRNLLV